MPLKVDLRNKKYTLDNKESNWFNNVSFDGLDFSTGKRIFEERGQACYSDIWGMIARPVKSGKVKPEDVGVRYYCHTGHLRVRLPLLEFISRKFSHYFSYSVLSVTDAGEPYVEVRSRIDTPLEIFYALGSFLRLTWEQQKDGLIEFSDPFEFVTKALHDDYTIHIPTLYFHHNFGSYKFTPAEEVELTRCMFHMLRYYNVFRQPLNAVGKLRVYSPDLQEKMYTGLFKTSRFRKTFPQLVSKC